MINWKIPYLTNTIPGIGGVIRSEPEDFVVEEVPAYEPCGEGEHTFFRVEKRAITTMALTKQIAQMLDIPAREVSSAGLKDKYAVAQQTLSVHNVAPETLLTLELDHAQVLWAKRHTNRLRSGHLRGNRFSLRIREPHPEAETRMDAIVEQLTARGVPNGYGEQRFGNRGDNHEVGMLLIHRDNAGLKERGLRRIAGRMKQFYISSLQSALFNQLLKARMERGLMDGLLRGDIAKKQETGGLFTVEDLDAELPRVAAWEINPTGAMYGYKMMPAQDEAGALEDEILAASELTLEDFRPVKAKGTRRPLRYRPDGLTWSLEDNVVSVSFFAPKGSFATMLLRELMKPEAADNA